MCGCLGTFMFFIYTIRNSKKFHLLYFCDKNHITIVPSIMISIIEEREEMPAEVMH